MENVNPKHLHDQYLSLKLRRDELTTQRARIEEKEKQYTSEINTSEFHAKQAQKELLSAEKRFVRDDITEQELKAARAQVSSIYEKLNEAKRLKELAAAAIPDIDAEIEAINGKIRFVLNRYCGNVKNQISEELNGDKNIHEKLLEAYGAEIVAGSYVHYWDRFLADIFPLPDNAELKQSVIDFRNTHDI